MIGQTISHYKITARLGAGGMGEVYLAEDTDLKRKVALKFLPASAETTPEMTARFQHEAQAAAALSHPNVATIYEVSEHEGRPYIVMEYVHGPTLAKYCEAEEPDVPEILDLAIQIGEGFKKAHAAGIVHRDLKPANILVDPDRRPKILDFGLAKLRGVTKVTKTGSTLGTAAYMSPEQAQGQDVDHRTDIWSFGVILYEMVARRLPFDAEHEAALAYAVTHEEPEPLARYKAGVSNDLQRIVTKCLAKNPGERYQSAADLVADLRTLKKGRVATAAQAPPRGHRRLAISGAAVVLIVASVLVFRPWHVVVEPTKEAFARENRLAVMYFDNLVDPEDSDRLGEIAANLIMSDLSASSYLQVVSSQRLYDVLKLLGKEGTKHVDRETATQVAEKTEARWMITGSILRLEPSIILAAQLVEVKSGSIVASPKVTGTAGQDIFSIVDTLTRQTKEHLSLPAAALAEHDYGVAELTTMSTEAYGHFLKGWDLYYQMQWAKAAEEFNRAVQTDTTFAMAYYGLSFVATGRADIAKETIAKARSHMRSLSEGNRMRIVAREAELNRKFEEAIAILERLVAANPDDKEALYRLGTLIGNWRSPKEAIPVLLKVIAIDPHHKWTYNLLAYAYQDAEKGDSAAWAANKYVELAPDEPNPYDSRGDIYRRQGKLDAAIASYGQALQIDSLFTHSLTGLVHICTYKGDYEAAENALQRKLRHPDRGTRSAARWDRVHISYFQGRLNEAMRRAHHAYGADVLEYGDDYPLYDHLSELRQVYYDLLQVKNYGPWRDSLARLDDQVRELVLRDGPPDREGRSALSGRAALHASLLGDSVSAETSLQKMQAALDTSNQRERSYAHSIRAVVKFRQGQFDSAIAYALEGWQAEGLFDDDVWLGRVNLFGGHLGEAVDLLERASTRFDWTRFEDGTSAVRLHYWLGLAYEKSGWRDKAIEQYETFLEIWKDADEGIIDLEDARGRLARLKERVG